MTEFNTAEENNGGKFTSLFAFIYLIITGADILFRTNIVSQSGIMLSLVSELAVPFAVMIIYYMYLSSMGENGNKGALLIIIPTTLSVVSGYMSDNFSATLSALFAFLSPTLASAVIYCTATKKDTRATACAGASFIMFAMSALETVLAIFIAATEKGVRFGTVLFDGLSAFIDEVIMIYMETLSAAAAMYGITDISQLSQGTEYLEETLISTIATAPAVMCAVYFFVVYICTRVADYLSVTLGVYDTRKFTRFAVSRIVNTIFHVCAVIIMFSILFENKTSAFTFGIFSILIVLLPNYIILGLRRIFEKLIRVMPKGAASLIVMLILFAGFMISSYILILVIVFFGTAEYRASRINPIIR